MAQSREALRRESSEDAKHRDRRQPPRGGIERARETTAPEHQGQPKSAGTAPRNRNSKTLARPRIHSTRANPTRDLMRRQPAHTSNRAIDIAARSSPHARRPDSRRVHAPTRDGAVARSAAKGIERRRKASRSPAGPAWGHRTCSRNNRARTPGPAEVRGHRSEKQKLKNSRAVPHPLHSRRPKSRAHAKTAGARKQARDGQHIRSCTHACRPDRRRVHAPTRDGAVARSAAKGIERRRKASRSPTMPRVEPSNVLATPRPDRCEGNRANTRAPASPRVGASDLLATQPRTSTRAGRGPRAPLRETETQQLSRRPASTPFAPAQIASSREDSRRTQASTRWTTHPQLHSRVSTRQPARARSHARWRSRAKRCERNRAKTQASRSPTSPA
jgi:hypothetical protein